MESGPLPPHRLLARQILLLLAVYTGLRLTFLVIHLDLYNTLPASQVVLAFFRGIRFDLAAIALSNAPLVLLALAPARARARPGYHGLLRGLFVGVNTLLACVMVADLEYFSFTGTRITFDVLHMGSAAVAQSGQLVVNYAPLAALALAIGVLLYRLHPDPRQVGRTRHAGHPRPPELPVAGWIVEGASRLAILALVVVAARGGFQKKVLSPIHAFESGSQELGILTLNSAFTLLKSPLQPELEPVSFFPTDALAAELLESEPGFTHELTGGPNVVVLILESLATEFWGAANPYEGYTPFLDSLASQGIFLRNNFANGRRSIEALPSVLLGVPSLMSKPLARSGFEGNRWRGLGHLLGEEGYHTSFFHGAPRGTMYFDAIARMAGMRDYYPLERYPAELQERDFDGHWGLYDEPFLQFVVERLGRHPQPFFSTVFTISSHQPYRVPAEYLEVLPEGELEIHQSVRYVDLAVEAFFASARKEPWFENTLFIITGDHTQASRSLHYDTFLGRYMVPLLLYRPQGGLPAVDRNRVTQHADILHTILDVVGVEPRSLPRFGRSVFSPEPGEAVLHSNGTYWLVREEGVLQRDPQGEETLFEFAGADTRPEEVESPGGMEERLALRLRAHLQHHHNSLLSNSLYGGGLPGPSGSALLPLAAPADRGRPSAADPRRLAAADRGRPAAPDPSRSATADPSRPVAPDPSGLAAVDPGRPAYAAPRQTGFRSPE